jgi:hypothetical protein
MDRDKVTKTTAQIGFIKFVLIPLFESLSKVCHCWTVMMVMMMIMVMVLIILEFWSFGYCNYRMMVMTI